MDEFHQHLNSINPHIQFPLELEGTKGQGLLFLDTITTRRCTQLEANFYRKPTHTDRYLDFNSHHPMCHKRSVVSTLLRRAQNIPSTQKGKREKTKRAKAVLRKPKLFCSAPLPSSVAAKDRCRNSLTIYRSMALWCYPMCRAFQKGSIEY